MRTGRIWLLYYHARYYDPALGRFIQPDSVLDGLNRYTYCQNNPVRYIDPTGREKEKIDFSLSIDSLNFPKFTPTPSNIFPTLPTISIPTTSDSSGNSGSGSDSTQSAKAGVQGYEPIGKKVIDWALRSDIAQSIYNSDVANWVRSNSADLLNLAQGIVEIGGGYGMFILGLDLGALIGVGSSGALLPVGVAVGAVGVTAGTAAMVDGVKLVSTAAVNIWNNTLMSQGNGGKADSRWHEGSFDSSENSLNYHFKKHGDEVGVKTVEDYLKKAENFANNLRGANRSSVNGVTDGVMRFTKGGKYIDIAPDGRIISFGSQ